MRHRIIEHLQKDEKPATSATKRHQSSWPAVLTWAALGGSQPAALLGEPMGAHQSGSPAHSGCPRLVGRHSWLLLSLLQAI